MAKFKLFFKRTYILAGSALAAVNAQAQESLDNRPNIIFFLVDDMGWQDTSLPFWTEKTPLNHVYSSLCLSCQFSFENKPDDRNECCSS